MQLVHKLEEFVDHRLQELPVSFQKARILSNNILEKIVVRRKSQKIVKEISIFEP